MYEMGAASGQLVPGGLNNNQPPSYAITAMGPTGSSARVPAAIPSELNYMMPDQLPLGGQGMSTGRGGGRNRKA